MPAQSSRGRHAGRGGGRGSRAGHGGGGGRQRGGALSEYDSRRSGRHHGRDRRGARGGDRDPTERLFEPNFPAPGAPPRRTPPSLHHSHDPLHAPLLHSHGAGGGIGGANAAAAANGVVYRTADSTQRALNELARKRHERMERRRAAALLVALFCLAVGVHYAGAGGWIAGAKGGGGSLRSGGKGEDEGGDKIEALASGGGEGGGSSEGGGGDGGGGGGKTAAAQEDLPEEEEEEPEEPVIPEGKEFLAPLKYFADARSTPRRSDTPFFFHIPRSGGQTVKDIVGQCLGKVLASEVGVRDGHGTDPTLSVVEIKNNKYVNVDTTSIDGIQRAASLGLAESKLANLVTSSYLKEAGALFDLRHQGRAFLIMRNPVERAVSMYYQRTRGENADLDSSLTLEDFAQGNGIENNWMTRFLVDAMEGELSKQHLEQAKEVLEKKFLIGFLDDGDETMARVMRYYDWEYSPDETERMKQEDCMKELLKDGTNVNPDGYDMPKKGTQAFALIMWQTQFDLKLYDYARELFDQQTKHWGTKERKKELKKKKKGGK